jgi:hypothetical protein
MPLTGRTVRDFVLPPVSLESFKQHAEENDGQVMHMPDFMGLC